MRLSALLNSFLLCCMAFVATSVHAQTLGAEPLTVVISPEYPQPYQTISITPQSTLFDLNASTVTISVNGKTIRQGSGGQGVAYTVGAAGETDAIKVTATAPGGAYSAAATVRPASVALIVEPISTVHPFYEGASLVAPQGRLRIIAFSELRSGANLVAGANLVYTWKMGNQLLAAQSGIGHSVLTMIAPLRYRDTPVSVTVSTPDDSIAGQATVTISPVDPLMVLYHNSPLIGPDFDSALGTTFSMSGSEDSFRAVPYFFASAPSLVWSMNGEKSSTDPVITVRTTGNSSGTAALSAIATQASSYQSAQGSLSVLFGQTTGSTNIFGL